MPLKTKKKEPEINLLPSKNFSETITGRVLLWITSTFRIIVIFTELLVMIAFLSRFWLDAKINDQKDEIANKKAAITSTTEFEEYFKSTQTRLNIYKEIMNFSPSVSKWFSNITNSLPADVYLTSMSYFLSENKILIEGISPNEISIQQLMVNAKNKTDFSKVSLSELKTNEENLAFLNFKILLELAKSKKE